MCHQCWKFYKNKKTLQTHLKYDCGKPKKNVCYVCGYKTNRKFVLKTHFATVHRDINSPL